MRQPQRGFTILEVMIVITIAAFIMASAMPSVGAWMRNTRIRTAAESISIGLQQARNEAVRRNQPVGFYLVSETDTTAMSDACALSASSGGWVVSLASPAGKCATNRDTFIAARPAGNVSGGLSVTSVDSAASAATSISFNGYGQVTGANAIACVRVRNTADTTARGLNISVNAGGQVRMCDPAVGSSDPRACPAECT
ncbi:MAG TPA: GspH/FimT family pseudopilin [Burkholderiaceae bacterium]|nr:GspH/FimT family pseudopilin [Burkholderiaceae bacterium]